MPQGLSHLVSPTRIISSSHYIQVRQQLCSKARSQSIPGEPSTTDYLHTHRTFVRGAATLVRKIDRILWLQQGITGTTTTVGTTAVRSNFGRDVVIRPGSHQKVGPYLSAPAAAYILSPRIPKRHEQSNATHVYMSYENSESTVIIFFNRRCIFGRLPKKGVPR